MSDIQSLITTSASQMRLSPTLEINELVLATRAQGKKVVHLGFGEATFPIQKDVLAVHQKQSQSTCYMPVAGLRGLREAIAKFNARRLGVNIDPEQVVIAPGSKPLLFTLFDILKGDVLLPRPSWVSYEPQVQHAKKRLFWVETDEHDRHTITSETLEAAYASALKANADPRIMLINSPSNPTAQVFTSAVIETVSKFCRERGILLISDEIYSDLCFDPAAVRSSAFTNSLDSDTTVIITGGLSKTYSAGGWRIGYAIFPLSQRGNAIRTATLAYASECWSAASTPAQLASIEAFSTSEEMDRYRSSVTALHRYCTLALYEALQRLGLYVAKPEGAFYVYPSFQPYTAQLAKLNVHTSVQLSKWLISECGVAALPGSVFGEDDNGIIGGRLRLRMASSYLYFGDETERYTTGYELLDLSMAKKSVELPLLAEAINALEDAVEKLRKIKV